MHGALRRRSLFLSLAFFLSFFLSPFSLVGEHVFSAQRESAGGEHREREGLNHNIEEFIVFAMAVVGEGASKTEREGGLDGEGRACCLRSHFVFFQWGLL